MLQKNNEVVARPIKNLSFHHTIKRKLQVFKAKKRNKIASFLTVVLSWSCTFPLDGTIGTFLTGYGARSIGMGDTAVANPQESMVIATNPAGISFLENRFDANLMIFNPVRSYRYSLPTPTRSNSQRDIFVIPNFSTNVSCDGYNSFGIVIILFNSFFYYS